MKEPLTEALRNWDGVARRSDLLASGTTQADLDRALLEREIVRVRHGVYALPGIDRQVLRAVRVGGALASVSATRRRGLWQPPGLELCVSVRRNAARLRDPDSARRRLTVARSRVTVLYDGDTLGPDERLVVGVERCVIQVVATVEDSFALAVLDSSLRLPVEVRPDLSTLAANLPGRRRAVLAAADARAESGTESILRWRLEQAGIPCRIQLWVTSGIRVDFLLSTFLVVECTSVEHHSSRRQYEADRARIAALVRSGYVVLEFTYQQVLFEFDLVLATIWAALSRGWA